MPLEVRVTLPAGIDSAAALLSEELGNGLRDAGMAIENEAKHLVPVRTGNLRRSIMSSVETLGGTQTGIVAAQAGYGRYVESGTKPHTPPLSAIATWANRKGLPAGAIWMAIRKKGTKAHPFMAPALEAKRSVVIDTVQEAIKTFVARVIG